MDGRKAFILFGGILCGLIGCTPSQTRQPNDPLVSSALPPKPPAQANNTPVNVRKDNVEPAKELQAKPATCVAMGDLYAQCSADEKRSPQDRAQFNMKAQDAYRRALQQDPKNVPAYVGLAKVQELAGDREGALKTWQAALTKLPNDPKIWSERGMFLGRMQNFNEATASLAQASKLDPRNMEYIKNVGFMLARQGRDEEALTWLRKAMTEADAQYNVAGMMQHIGQDETCRRHLMLALQNQPSHAPALKMLTERNQPPAQRGAVETAQYTTQTPDSGNVAAVYQPNPSLAVPTRAAFFPEDPSAKPASAPLPPAPVIPVVLDSWDRGLMPAMGPGGAANAPPPAATSTARPMRKPPVISTNIEQEP
ncbi:MAG TPA: tetratricopeptide repeat protein [Gemmataceae bacterium]|jgi:Tfp pilus assembly protein PilF|nr:tetratricopeptide repeat protein [Gemmataceae bacterium]